MTYRVHYTFGGNPVDHDVAKYSEIRFWGAEINALRYANDNGLKCISVEAGLVMK